MRLLDIQLQRFGSFTKEVEFVFPQVPGLYFLCGVNEREPALGANGAGKSTLWNAICWVLFDRNVKGLRAGDVANWDEPKGAVVTLHFMDTLGCEQWVRRQHAPNRWEWSDGFEWFDLTKHADNPVLAELRLSIEPFLNCVLMGQGRPMFLDLSATEKARLFSDVLSLDVWDARSKRAAERAKELDARSRDLERQLSNVVGKLEGIDHRKLDGNAEEWETDRRARIEDLASRHQRALADRKALVPVLRDLENRRDAARGQLKHADELLVAGRRELDDATRAAARALALADASQRQLSDLCEERERRRHMNECPTCGQRVDAGKLVADIQKVLTPLSGKQVELWEVEGQAREERKQCMADLRPLEDAVDNARKVLERADRDVRDQERSIQFLDRDLDALEDAAEGAQNERNPFAGMRDDARRDERLLTQQRDDLQSELDEANSQQYRANFWVRGFKEVRLRRIRESLAEYEIEANSNVAELGLLDWSLRFDVDKETKSGTTKSGFDVRVLSPHNDRPVPWEAWSGGEGQRLRLAGQAGLADLIRSRTQTPLNLEVWDEPTEHMSGRGVTDLLDALAERARRTGRQIWVVDHRSLGYGGFTDVYTVVKDGDGSRFTH